MNAQRRKPNILIIEDNPVSRKVLKLCLESEHHNVVEAPDATTALKEASTQKFDLIVQDLFLPDMDGFSLNKKLRELPDVKEIPIFALSGFLSPSDKQAQHTGFTTFLLKPISPAYFLDVVKAHLPDLAIPTKVAIGSGKHILIADDNAIQLKLFSMQLKNVGFQVTTAEDGAIALKKAIQNPPDLIISDILMPNMDGFSLCLEIRQNTKLSKIPIMLLSAYYLEDDDIALAKKVGANSYLTRTPDVNNVITELLKILNDAPVVSSNASFALTEEIKEKHTIRSIRQLEQQVLDNAKLAQRCSLLTSQLSLIDGIANTLITSSTDLDAALKEVLYFCLDATGISKGALYLTLPNHDLILNQQLGYAEDQKEELILLFGLSSLATEIIKKNEPVIIPSEYFSDENVQKFLEGANVKSAILMPLFSGIECKGLLFLGSGLGNLIEENIREFVRTLGMQIGQSLALASTFEELDSSEKRYRQLVEISPDAIFIQQEDKFSYANTAALKLLKASRVEELSTQSFYDFFPIESQEIIKEYIQRDNTQTSISFLESKIVNLKGDILYVEIVISHFLYQGKQSTYMIMRDITERKLSALQLEIQYAIAWILAESATLFVATGKILKLICARLQWDCGILWAVDNNENVLRCTRIWQTRRIQNHEFEVNTQNFVFTPGIGLPGQVWKDRKAIWRSDISHEATFLRRKSTAKIGLNTAVAFPIIFENNVLGVIEFLSKNILQSSPELLLLFESIGNQFGLFLTRKHMETHMLYLSEHDVLTGLFNRKQIEEHLETELILAKEKNLKLAILYLDLDHFKYVNDSLGHHAGDLLLKEIAMRFNKILQPHGKISRLGGDEFVIIISNVHEKAVVLDVITKLQHQLSSQVVLQEKEFFITASIGISLYPQDGDSVQTLMKAADIAMHVAKAKGRNNFQFCTPEMTSTAENKSVLQNDLRKALENNEFVLYYQPKVSVATQKIIGMEALIRWKKQDTIIFPRSFIAAAEESDLIIPLGEWVLKAACSQNKAWQDAGLTPVTMSMNLSVRNLNNQILHMMEKTLNETKLNPHCIEIELTESALMENIENNIQILRSLKDMGLKISIDDFGTGYSSLSYLKRFPIDVIKIDQSFVRDIATDPDDAAIVTAIIAMSHSLGFTVIAEGVETKEQLKFLCEHGCDEIQGFYFSRSLPVAEATDFIKNANTSWHFD